MEKEYKDGYLLHFTDTFDLQRKVDLILNYQDIRANETCARLDNLQVKYTRLKHGTILIDGSSINPEKNDEVRNILSEDRGIKSLHELCEITEIK